MVFFMLLGERANQDFRYLLSVSFFYYCGSNESEEKHFAASGGSLFKLVLSGVPLLGKLLNRLIRELQNTKKKIKTRPLLPKSCSYREQKQNLEHFLGKLGLIDCT